MRTSRKYTRSKKDRTHGAYQERLSSRGLVRAPKMPFFKEGKDGWVKTERRPA